MKTQISLKVKKSTFISRYVFWAWNIFFKKGGVSMILDGVPYEAVKPRKEPYVFDVQPGSHEITFIDTNANKKRFATRAAGALATTAIAWSGGVSFPISAMLGGDIAEACDCVVRDGVLYVKINEGDLLQISVQPNLFGNVKIKVLN